MSADFTFVSEQITRRSTRSRDFSFGGSTGFGAVGVKGFTVGVKLMLCPGGLKEGTKLLAPAFIPDVGLLGMKGVAFTFATLADPVGLNSFPGFICIIVFLMTMFLACPYEKSSFLSRWKGFA